MIAIPVIALLLAGCLAAMPHSAPLFHALFPDLDRPVFDRVGLVELTLSHIALVAIATALAAVVAIPVAVLVTRAGGRTARPLVMAVAAVGQTFPPVAVLAIAIPLMGYGGAPVVVALFAYSLLPIVLTGVAGLEAVPASVLDAADGMGLSPFQRLMKAELPLAAPVLLAGLRTAAIINVGTATVGSTVGAATLGAPIIEGLSSYNTAYVIQGAVLVGLLAILIDRLFEAATRLTPARRLA